GLPAQAHAVVQHQGAVVREGSGAVSGLTLPVLGVVLLKHARRTKGLDVGLAAELLPPVRGVLLHQVPGVDLHPVWAARLPETERGAGDPAPIDLDHVRNEERHVRKYAAVEVPDLVQDAELVRRELVLILSPQLWRIPGALVLRADAQAVATSRVDVVARAAEVPRAGEVELADGGVSTGGVVGVGHEGLRGGLPRGRPHPGGRRAAGLQFGPRP